MATDNLRYLHSGDRTRRPDRRRPPAPARHLAPVPGSEEASPSSRTTGSRSGGWLVPIAFLALVGGLMVWQVHRTIAIWEDAVSSDDRARSHLLELHRRLHDRADYESLVRGSREISWPGLIPEDPVPWIRFQAQSVGVHARVLTPVSVSSTPFPTPQGRALPLWEISATVQGTSTRQELVRFLERLGTATAGVHVSELTLGSGDPVGRDPGPASPRPWSLELVMYGSFPEGAGQGASEPARATGS